MRLNYDLLREILLDTEATPLGEIIRGFGYEGRDPLEVAEHTLLLITDGFLDGTFTTDHRGFPCVFAIHRLTMKGHEFIQNAKNPTVWETVVGGAKSRGDSLSMGVLSALLGKAAMKFFGLG